MNHKLWLLLFAFLLAAQPAAPVPAPALARISHRLTVEACDRRAITSLRLLAVLDVLSSTPPLVKQRAPRTDAPLTHFASPRGEKSGLANAAAEPNVRVVNLVAERFFFVPSRITVSPGTTIEFNIRSADTNHGFRIRKAGINVVVPKRGGGVAKVVFHAAKKGRYDFECSKPCGAGHNTMRGTIVVK